MTAPIENTASRASMEATVLLALATGDTDAIITGQERAGQQQLVNSDRLPTNLEPPREEFEALGFTFGDPDPSDPLFMPATLPPGWRREGSDHAMWSYLVDDLGRRRAAIFYKAAFYDRRAAIHLTRLDGYVDECVREGKEIVTDDTWATRPAIADAARRLAQQAQKGIRDWQAIASRNGEDETTAKYIAQHEAERDRYVAVAEKYATSPESTS